MPLTFSKTSLICIFLIDSIDKFPQFILDFLLFLFGANNLLALLLDCFRAAPDHQLQFLNKEKTRTTNSAILVKHPAAKSRGWISFSHCITFVTSQFKSWSCYEFSHFGLRMNETIHLFQVNVEDRIPTEGVREDVGHPKPAMKSNHHEELVRKVLMNVRE